MVGIGSQEDLVLYMHCAARYGPVSRLSFATSASENHHVYRTFCRKVIQTNSKHGRIATASFLPGLAYISFEKTMLGARRFERKMGSPQSRQWRGHSFDTTFSHLHGSE